MGLDVFSIYLQRSEQARYRGRTLFKQGKTNPQNRLSEGSEHPVAGSIQQTLFAKTFKGKMVSSVRVYI